MQNAVPTSISQLTYRSLYSAVLTWILGANSRAVTIRYRLVAAFVAGLLWSVVTLPAPLSSGVAKPATTP